VNKIIIILPSLKTVSPVRAALSMIKGLAPNYIIYVVSVNSDMSESNSIENDLKILNIKYEFLNCNGLKNIFLAKNKLQKIIKNSNPDIILSYLLRPDLIVSMVKTKAIKISSIRNMIEHEYIISHGLLIGKLFGFFHKLALKRFDKLIVMSNDMKSYFIDNKFKSKDLELIHNSLDEKDLELKSKEIVKSPFLNNLPILITISSLIKRKNISLLLNTSIELLSKGCKFNILIIGDGADKDNLINIINNSKYKNNFHFLGYVSNPIPYLINSNIFIMTSISEGVSRSLMEALYLGKACIVSNIDGNRELIKDGENGYLFSDKIMLKTIIAEQLVDGFKVEENLLLKEFRYDKSIELHKKLLEGLKI
jgi:glycosyltransferase involved in cell wall biosynthesis